MVSRSVCQAIRANMFVKANTFHLPCRVFIGVRGFARIRGSLFAGERGHEIDNPLANFSIMNPGKGHVQMQALGGR